jgi:hypothetical protein
MITRCRYAESEQERSMWWAGLVGVQQQLVVDVGATHQLAALEHELEIFENETWDPVCGW